MGKIYKCADNIINDFTSVFSTNLYAYCNNNPINLKDTTGNTAEAIAITTGISIAGNFWNPFGWIIFGTVVAVAVAYGIYKVVDYFSQPSSSGAGGATGSASSTPASPEPPNNKNNKGTRNSKIKQAVKNGQKVHKEHSYGANTIKEFRLSSNARVDAISFQDRIIYELKPNNPWSIARGNRQLARYVDIATKKYGGVWKGKLTLY